MAKFESDITAAVEACLQRNIPFCLFAMPGNTSSLRFFANPSGPMACTSEEIRVVNWMQPASEGVSIKAECDEHSIMHALPRHSSISLPQPWDIPTLRERYIQRISTLIDRLKLGEAQKVVISRTHIAYYNGFGPRCIVDIAASVFNAYTGSFRFLYLTPSTGVWLGASPELLADYDSSTGTLRTMALAGTRTECDHSPMEPWDAKDIREQAIVTNFICTELEGAGFSVQTGDPFTLSTGNLQHIATLITAQHLLSPAPDANTVVDILNPTPALCGDPRDTAAAMIKEIEDHPRNCYGGGVAYVDAERMQAFVNLRCVNLGSEYACIYAGGGIIADSEPDKEWVETENKVNTILKFLNRESGQ